MIKKTVSVIILLVFIGGCDRGENQWRGMMGGGMMSGGGMMGEVNIPGDRPPEETDTKYVQGYQQAKITCTQCHVMPHPNQHSSTEWPGVIARMQNNIRTFKKVMPNGDELNSIIDYYVGNSG